ncbi:MAG: ABC transporter ATP-binding protein [Candidatus Coatesbacteria bacterium]|nr:ABC transporter ATP-binding protein [Candidatus Coatesbacteria bacterium]
MTHDEAKMSGNRCGDGASYLKQAIRVRDVSKKYRVYYEKSDNIKYLLINLLKGKRDRYQDVWALKDIDISIGRGETVGIIGDNGSGKSTLLKLLSGILLPDSGSVQSEGKMATLLELGSGFSMELSGRKNVFMNASILGLSRKEARSRFDEIVGFSELGEFINAPIKSYSSGMLVRLGFAVAISVEADIFLIDEILAVGDERFQKKCLDRIRDLQKSGRTIVLVSHNMDTISAFCSRAILLSKGKIVADGKPDDVIVTYRNRGEEF